MKYTNFWKSSIKALIEDSTLSFMGALVSFIFGVVFQGFLEPRRESCCGDFPAVNNLLEEKTSSSKQLVEV